MPRGPIAKDARVKQLGDDILRQVRAMLDSAASDDDLMRFKLNRWVFSRLLQDEIKIRRRSNVVQAQRFSEMLERALIAYKNRAISTVEFIEELIRLAQEMREADRRGEALGLSTEEIAFYDALATNDSAVQVLGDDVLRQIALELVDTVRRNSTIDWTLRESVRAKLRVRIKRVLRKHGYPPDKQEAATRTVLAQAEVLCADWAA